MGHECLPPATLLRGGFVPFVGEKVFQRGKEKHFLANEWDKATAQKRGGRQTFVPIDHHTAETRYGLEPADPLSADKIFERRWALALLEHVLANLREEYSTAGKADLFEALKSSLTGERSAIGYAQLAPKLG